MRNFDPCHDAVRGRDQRPQFPPPIPPPPSLFPVQFLPKQRLAESHKSLWAWPASLDKSISNR